MKLKIVFTAKTYLSGLRKQMLIYVPASIKKLINPEKYYKIILEEIEEKS